MIGTGSAKDSTAAFPVTSKIVANTQGTFDAAQIPTQVANRATYVQISKTDTGNYALETDYATHTFGRLGQSKDTGLDGKPFALAQKGGDTVKAGFQISLFPEIYLDANSKWEFKDWTLADETRPTILTKAVAANTSDLVSKTASASPTAISTVTVGAQALAVSIIATATIAATLF